VAQRALARLGEVVRQRHLPWFVILGEHLRDVRANQRVPGLEVVVEEGKRLVRRERFEPHRELRQLDGHPVHVHAVDALP
jgi:hypothetical protein